MKGMFLAALFALGLAFLTGLTTGLELAVGEKLEDVECFVIKDMSPEGWEPALELERYAMASMVWSSERSLRCRAFFKGSVTYFDASQLWIKRR